jgi:glycerate kinase
MKMIVAPDSFKGSVTAVEFCQIAEQAIQKLVPDAEIVKLPLADGGEGTVESLVSCTGGSMKTLQVTGPMGDPVEAFYGILGDGETAVVEMACASGLPLVPEGKRNPMKATTYGTGELILKILDEGCSHLIMGIGGSATNDGGAGMLQALGFDLLDENGQAIAWGAEGLQALKRIETGKADPRLGNLKVEVACDVDNPLVGDKGASVIYGPQKGADPAMVEAMDQALQNFADCIDRDLGKQVADLKGAGAAGGLGAGLYAFLDADLRMGFEIIRETVSLDQHFTQDVDLVITGEGQMNYQTLHGKLPVGISRLSKANGIPAIAIVGSIGRGIEALYDEGIVSIFSIMDKPMSLEDAMANGKVLLADTIERTMRLFLSCKG